MMVRMLMGRVLVSGDPEEGDGSPGITSVVA